MKGHIMLAFKNILVAIDASREDQPVVEYAARLAESHQAKLTVMDVMPDFSWFQRAFVREVDHLRTLLAQEKADRLQVMVAEIRDRGVAAKSKVVVGRTSVEIIRQAMRGKHDLVMRHTKGSLSRRTDFIGTTSLELIRKCPCPVWIFGPDEIKVSRVLATVDATPDDERHRELNHRILDLSESITKFENASLDVVHAWEVYRERLVRPRMSAEEFSTIEQSADSEAQRGANLLLAAHGLKADSPNVHLLHGSPDDVIPYFVSESQIDVVVMGSVGRRGVPGMLIGNTAELLLAKLRCSILVVKPDDFVSPIKARGQRTATRMPPVPIP
jgi:nucleotide-binding universal stress UspA family protein